jgi:hypothetical protein
MQLRYGPNGQFETRFGASAFFLAGQDASVPAAIIVHTD